MDAQLIVEMEGKKTRLVKPRLQSIRDAGREAHHDFTFDYSYWSFDAEDSHFATQEQVYNDLGNDVVDCAYEGKWAASDSHRCGGSGRMTSVGQMTHLLGKDCFLRSAFKSCSWLWRH